MIGQGFDTLAQRFAGWALVAAIFGREAHYLAAIGERYALGLTAECTRHGYRGAERCPYCAESATAERELSTGG